MIYLDNNATTQLAQTVIEVMERALRDAYGNPSSAHSAGDEPKRIMAESREEVAELLGAADPSQVVFTSGGTESDNWAILGSLDAFGPEGSVVTTRVEHEAIRRVCERLEANGRRVTWLEVDEQGKLDLDQVRDSLDANTALVSVMMANNETGVIFPVEAIAEVVKERSNALFHVDGVNAAGKIPIDLKRTEIDLFSISAHKFHGPKGIGALYVRDEVKLSSMLIGGGQETGRRAGTEAVHQIAGMGAAARFVADLTPMEQIRELRDRLEDHILTTVSNTSVNGSREHSLRLPNTTNISFENSNGEMILHRLNEAGICVSTGSACNSESRTSSPVLAAMNVPYTKAMGSIRFSLGRYNRTEEIDLVLDKLPRVVEKLGHLASRILDGIDGRSEI